MSFLSITDSLISACMQNSDLAVEAALKFGADVHVNNEVCVKYAVQVKSLKILRLLRQFGADVHANNYYAAITAANNGDIRILKYLIEECSLPQKTKDFCFLRAAKNEDLNTMDFLLNYDITNSVKNIAILIITLLKNKDISKFLQNLTRKNKNEFSKDRKLL